MGKEVLRDQKLWFGGRDLTGVMNSLGLDYGADAVEDTTFGQQTHTFQGGLKSVAASHQGFFDAAAYEADLFDNVGVDGVPMSYSGPDAAEGAVAFTFQSMESQYAPGGSVGEMMGFSLAAAAAGDLIRGTLGANRSAASSSGNSAAFQLGAVGAAQKLYGVLHVTEVAGTLPTLDVTIESDDASGFASPTTRITFAQKTARGYEWATPIDGAIADDWWRVAWTIGGTTPAFTFACILGIQ